MPGRGPGKAEGGSERATGAETAPIAEAAAAAEAGFVDAPAGEESTTEVATTRTASTGTAVAAAVTAGRPAREASATRDVEGALGGHERALTAGGCAVDGGRASVAGAELV